MRRSLAVPAAAALLVACGPSIYYHRDASLPIPARATWAWSAPDDDGLSIRDGARTPPDSIADVIRAAIEEALVTREFVRVPTESAQFVVHFHAGRRTVVDTLPRRDDPSGVGADPRPSGGWGTYGDPEAIPERTFAWEEGMLIVDVLPRGRRAVAWRGAIVTEIPAEAERDARPSIRHAVRRLMRGFP